MELIRLSKIELENMKLITILFTMQVLFRAIKIVSSGLFNFVKIFNLS